jgi:hypothetical protein
VDGAGTQFACPFGLPYRPDRADRFDPQAEVCCGSALHATVAAGSNWPASWTAASEPCDTGWASETQGWLGVRCDAERGRIVYVRPADDPDFDATAVTGDVTGWFTLTSATTIDVNSCTQLTGDVSLLDGSSTLQYLAVSGTQICGKRPASVMSNLVMCCAEGEYGTADECIYCPLRSRCTGSGCAKGYTGAGCTDCDDEAEPNPYVEVLGDCTECPSDNSGTVLLVLGTLAGVVGIVFVISGHAETATAAAEQTARIARNMSSLLLHLQLFSFSLSYEVYVPLWCKAVWAKVSGLVFLSVDNVAPPACYLPCAPKCGKSEQGAAKFAIMVVCLLLPPAALTIWHCCSRGCRTPAEGKAPSRALNARLIIFAMVYCRLASLMAELHTCVDVPYPEGGESAHQLRPASASALSDLRGSQIAWPRLKPQAGQIALRR